MALEPILDAGIQWRCSGADTPVHFVDDRKCSNPGVVFVWVFDGVGKYPSQLALCEIHLREIAAPLLEPSDV